ncbi:Zinc finger domain [Halapricum desulfuricans]|uniref:Zinc finger domain n=1 Tax=Halapricum desulfuricans TaxID=2841257 RepID=A0A897N369_9EURY|nr:Zinc finger domain [Halapricum desulfuricans]
MSVSGLCDVCGQPDVDHVCDRCGRLVCDRHYDAELGVCTECGSEIRGNRDDADTYRF